MGAVQNAGLPKGKSAAYSLAIDGTIGAAATSSST